MKTLRRAISVLLVFAMSVCLLAGCGETETTTTPTVPGAEAGKPVEEVKEQEVTTISFWTADSGSQAVFTELVKEFNDTVGKEKGIILDYQVRANDLQEQIELAFTTGQAPDIFITSNLVNHVENGHIAAIEDLPGGADFLKTYQDAKVLEDGKHMYKGKTYCVPVTATTYGLAYNKDMFKAAGLVDENGEATPPKTWEEFREYAKILTNPAKQEYGIALCLGWGSWFWRELQPMVQASNGRSHYVPTEGRYDYTIYNSALELFMGMKEDGSVYPGAETLDNDTARARFAEGGIGMKLSVSWDVGVFNDQFPAKCDWGVAPLPVENPDEIYYQQYDLTYGPYINAKSVAEKDPEKLMAVFEWYHSAETLAELYKNGVSIPWDFNLVKDVQLENPKKGWVDFCSLTEISHVAPTSIKSDISGFDGAPKIFTDYIWSGKMSIEEGMAQITETANNGIKTYQSIYPEYDPSTAILDEWDLSR